MQNDLEVGHRIRVVIEDNEDRTQRKVDGATVLELRDDGNHLVKCDAYRGTDANGVQNEIRPLNHFAGWEMEDYHGEVENEVVED